MQAERSNGRRRVESLKILGARFAATVLPPADLLIRLATPSRFDGDRWSSRGLEVRSLVSVAREAKVSGAGPGPRVAALVRHPPVLSSPGSTPQPRSVFSPSIDEGRCHTSARRGYGHLDTVRVPPSLLATPSRALPCNFPYRESRETSFSSAMASKPWWCCSRLLFHWLGYSSCFWILRPR